MIIHKNKMLTSKKSIDFVLTKVADLFDICLTVVRVVFGELWVVVIFEVWFVIKEDEIVVVVTSDVLSLAQTKFNNINEQ